MPMRRLLGNKLPYIREGDWDPNLNTYSVDQEGKVRSCNVRVIPAEDLAEAFGPPLKPGDKVWRVVQGRFLDENQAQLRTIITVNVVDLEKQGLKPKEVGAIHGWPQESLPGIQEKIVTGALEEEKGVEFAMGGGFQPQGPDDLGSYWVGMFHPPDLPGLLSPDLDAWKRLQKRLCFTDLAVGFGMPGNRHVCYEIVFRLMDYQAVSPTPPQPSTVMTGKQYRVKLTWTDPKAGEGVMTIEGEVKE